jgi:hypothetical protein
LSERAVESREKDQTLLDKLSADQKIRLRGPEGRCHADLLYQWRDTQRRDFVRGVGRKPQSAAEELAIASDLPAAWPYVGGCNSLTSQPTSPDFIGSDAVAIFST